jgi:hypothetical protein
MAEDVQYSGPANGSVLKDSGYSIPFFTAASIFLLGAIALYSLTGYILYEMSARGWALDVRFLSKEEHPYLDPTPLNDREKYQFWGAVLTHVFAPILSLVSAIICTIVGMKFLKSSGVVDNYVIPSSDFKLLAPAIQKADEKAITQYIRLSSLSGVTGTFTKIGFTGLPLATMMLTLVLGMVGLFNENFFELSKLTLGAFLGSFVQRQSARTENEGARDLNY